MIYNINSNLLTYKLFFITHNEIVTLTEVTQQLNEIDNMFDIYSITFFLTFSSRLTRKPSSSRASVVSVMRVVCCRRFLITVEVG